MKEIDMLYREISARIEEKPTLEDAQLSRKTRYFQRSNRPDSSGSKEKKKPRNRSGTNSESSDDEMPTPRPKIRRETKEHDRKIVRIVLSDDDDDAKPCSSKSDSDDDIEILEEIRPVQKYTIKFRADPLAGRLPRWYHKRKAEREAEDLILAEKRAVRRKLEAEEAEKQRPKRLHRHIPAEKEAELEKKQEEEERLEKRRLKDRLRHQKKREEAKKEREASEGVTTASEKKRKAKKTSEEETEEPTRKLRKRAPKFQITDPSLDPSQISLEAPETIPWAKPLKRYEVNTVPSPLPSTATPIVTTPCPSLPTSPTSEEDAHILLDESDENVGVTTELVLVDQTPPPDLQTPQPTHSKSPTDPLDNIDEPLFFEEKGELIQIPEDEIDVIEDTFLSIFQDEFTLEEFDQYLPTVENE